jgi:hypothetical protein
MQRTAVLNGKVHPGGYRLTIVSEKHREELALTAVAIVGMIPHTCNLDSIQYICEI